MTFTALGLQLFLLYLHNAAGPRRNSLVNAGNYLYYNRKSPKKTADKSGGSSHKADLIFACHRRDPVTPTFGVRHHLPS